ncbi:SDR family NAD(P)-dependent oxidoreductase, partial [Streptococcus thermophilus]|nr:SDR family NAD(P)-dependent oxidoreductase [Streptococcus thermophilus]
MKDFKDKVMFITGAAHGFGQVIAEGAADRGMKLTIVDIDEPALKKTYQHILDKGAEVLMVTADVT